MHVLFFSLEGLNEEKKKIDKALILHNNAYRTSQNYFCVE